MGEVLLAKIPSKLTRSWLLLLAGGLHTLLVTCYSNQKTLIQTGFKCANSSCERRSRKPLSFSNRGYMSLIEIPVSRMASVQFLTQPAAGVYRLWCLVRMDRFPFSPPVVGREGGKKQKGDLIVRNVMIQQSNCSYQIACCM